jgi:hypothetical protein
VTPGFLFAVGAVLVGILLAIRVRRKAHLQGRSVLSDPMYWWFSAAAMAILIGAILFVALR